MEFGAWMLAIFFIDGDLAIDYKGVTVNHPRRLQAIADALAEVVSITTLALAEHHVGPDEIADLLALREIIGRNGAASGEDAHGGIEGNRLWCEPESFEGLASSFVPAHSRNLMMVHRGRR